MLIEKQSTKILMRNGHHRNRCVLQMYYGASAHKSPFHEWSIKQSRKVFKPNQCSFGVRSRPYSHVVTQLHCNTQARLTYIERDAMCVKLGFHQHTNWEWILLPNSFVVIIRLANFGEHSRFKKLSSYFEKGKRKENLKWKLSAK